MSGVLFPTPAKLALAPILERACDAVPCAEAHRIARRPAEASANVGTRSNRWRSFYFASRFWEDSKGGRVLLEGNDEQVNLWPCRGIFSSGKEEAVKS